jgi:hypothetical protein
MKTLYQKDKKYQAPGAIIFEKIVLWVIQEAGREFSNQILGVDMTLRSEMLWCRSGE